MDMTPYTFQIKLTPRGRHYVIVTIGKNQDVVYVTRKAHSHAEPALTEARDYIQNNFQPQTKTESQKGV